MGKAERTEGEGMTREQFITEKVLGECWHEPIPRRIYDWGKVKCNKCGKLYWLENVAKIDDILRLSTPEGFFKLWNFCKEQEWWEGFIFEIIKHGTADHTIHNCMINLISPDVFANEIARYLGWEGEGI